ncbi:22628_t:CDS:2 [Gigaspora margarita]|uniref:22628_t:CDS:1 n=1 Tax=Gigaspora margarita TaxID=4874 RepID=A0ABN7W5N4_GIGMA|nr:22628_t:CDS:2 [Gigaspora margarita]
MVQRLPELKLVQHLIERTVLDINVPRADSLLLSDPPHAGDSEINSEDKPDRNSEWDLDDCAQTKGIVKKIYKRGVEFNECQHIKFYGCSNFDDDMLIFEWASLSLLFLSHLDIFHRDVRCENIMMTHYMEPKIANLYFAKHVSEIGLDNKDHIPNHISNVINWSAPEMMQNNALYTQEC